MALARGLGWFSIGLGLAEMLTPRMLTEQLGMEGKEPLLRFYGAREMAAGIGILMSDNPGPWIWGRVAGDALDLATLATGLDKQNPRKGNVAIALAAVAGVTALDCISRSGPHRHKPAGARLQRSPRHAAPAGRNARRRQKGFHRAARHAHAGGAAALYEPVGLGALARWSIREPDGTR